MARYLLETKDSANDRLAWKAFVGHDSAGVALMMSDCRIEWRNAFNEEDEVYLLQWQNDMWKLVDSGHYADGMTCSIEIDGCTFTFSHISFTKH